MAAKKKAKKPPVKKKAVKKPVAKKKKSPGGKAKKPVAKKKNVPVKYSARPLARFEEMMQYEGEFAKSLIKVMKMTPTETQKLAKSNKLDFMDTAALSIMNRIFRTGNAQAFAKVREIVVGKSTDKITPTYELAQLWEEKVREITNKHKRYVKLQDFVQFLNEHNSLLTIDVESTSKWVNTVSNVLIKQESMELRSSTGYSFDQVQRLLDLVSYGIEKVLAKYPDAQDEFSRYWRDNIATIVPTIETDDEIPIN